MKVVSPCARSISQLKYPTWSKNIKTLLEFEVRQNFIYLTFATLSKKISRFKKSLGRTNRTWFLKCFLDSKGCLFERTRGMIYIWSLFTSHPFSEYRSSWACVSSLLMLSRVVWPAREHAEWGDEFLILTALGTSSFSMNGSCARSSDLWQALSCIRSPTRPSLTDSSNRLLEYWKDSSIHFCTVYRGKYSSQQYFSFAVGPKYRRSGSEKIYKFVTS